MKLFKKTEIHTLN